MKKMNLILSGSLLVMSLGVLSPAVVYAGAETEMKMEKCPGFLMIAGF